jgi:hypothetical protein
MYPLRQKGQFQKYFQTAPRADTSRALRQPRGTHQPRPQLFAHSTGGYIVNVVGDQQFGHAVEAGSFCWPPIDNTLFV